MKQHRFFITADQLDGSTVRFSNEQAHHIRSVLRLRAGDLVRVFDGVKAVDRVVQLVTASEGTIIGERAHAEEPAARLVVYPALLQRDRFEQVLQKLTEIGAAAIVPLLTTRGLVREPPDEPRLARWRAILREAAEQSGRGVVPALLPGARLEEALAKAEGIRLVAYERERNRHLQEILRAQPGAPSDERPDTLRSKPATVSAFVGPEGGFTPEEAECAARAGAHLITLGPRVLRSETAAAMLAALVLYEVGDLSSGHADDE